MLPAYIKIHDQIKKDIDDAIWEIGERLPSERDLAETFKVSRMTLRQAITLLVEEGVLTIGRWSTRWLQFQRSSLRILKKKR